jgi:hypothetical protein
LLQNATNIDQVVGALDPEQHSLAFLALLWVTEVQFNATNSQYFSVEMCKLLFLTWNSSILHCLYRSLKVTFPNPGDFELLYTQIEQCVNMCPAEQIRLLKSQCKFSLRVLWMLKLRCFYLKGPTSSYPVIFHFSLPTMSLSNISISRKKTGNMKRTKV